MFYSFEIKLWTKPLSEICFLSDLRTADWFLSGKLGHLLVILVTYVYFCTKAGPRYMKDRKPYDLKTLIQLYNIIQIFASTYLVYLVSIINDKLE